MKKYGILFSLLTILNVVAFSAFANNTQPVKSKAKIEKSLIKKQAGSSKKTSQVKKIAKLSSINLNKANAKELAATLNGVGLKKAEAIVSFRKKNGSFKSIKDLTKVKGIGDAIFEKNKSLLTVK